MVTTRSSSRERSGKEDKQDVSPACPPTDDVVQPPPLPARKPSPPPRASSVNEVVCAPREHFDPVSLLDPPMASNGNNVASLPTSSQRSTHPVVRNPYVSSPKRTNQITPSLSSHSKVSSQESLMSIDDVFSSHVAYVRRNHHSTELASLADGATTVSDGYFYRRKKVINDFLSGLKSLSPKYDHLLRHSSDIPPTFRTKEKSVPIVLILLSGKDDKDKKNRLLSDMLIDWVSQLRRYPSIKLSVSSDSDEPGVSTKNNENGENSIDNNNSNNTHNFLAPSTINTYVRTLLSALKTYYGWEYSIKEDLGFDGGYAAFFSRLCSTRQKQDVSYFCVCD